MTGPLIEAKDISVVFGTGKSTVRAVDGVSLAVSAGEAVGIVGESGSGKSTLARVLAGIQEPTSGEAYFQGEPIFQGRKAYQGERRRAVQMVFQDPYGSLNPRMSAAATVTEAMKFHQGGSSVEAREKSLELLARMGISQADSRKKPLLLSGGQRQRVSVARALSARPSLLMADEPTSAIDQSAQAQLLNLFTGLLKEGLSIVLVSHDLGVIRYLTSRVYVMRLGVFVEQGETEQIFNDPQHEYTQTLIESIPGLERRGAAHA
jgi:ABC-type glutathione transport system ATPase component